MIILAGLASVKIFVVYRSILNTCIAVAACNTALQDVLFSLCVFARAAHTYKYTYTQHVSGDIYSVGNPGV